MSRSNMEEIGHIVASLQEEVKTIKSELASSTKYRKGRGIMYIYIYIYIMYS